MSRLPYSLEVRRGVEKVFEKIAKRDRTQEEAIKRKIQDILEEPHKFKPLRAQLAGKRAVHVLKSFILVYSVDEATKTVIIERYKHHDEAYSH